MSGTYSGTITTGVTLSPSVTSNTVTGTINAYGHIGTYAINYGGSLTSISFAAALFGPQGALFTVNNSGLIETQATTSTFFDAGIFLAEAGTVVNSGKIIGASGVAIDGISATSGALIENSGAIKGTIGVGAVLFTGGTVENTGLVFGTDTGVIFDTTAAGTITNLGVNATIASGHYAGVQLQGGGQVSNSGLITGLDGGIKLKDTNGGGIVLNAGTITQTATSLGTSGAYAAIDFNEAHTAALGNYVGNTLGGMITGQYGIRFNQNGSYSSPGTMTDTVMNLGIIQTSAYAAIADWSGTLVVDNAGSLISAQHTIGSATTVNTAALAGVVAGSAGYVNNTIGGVISGDWGVRLGYGEVVNQGTIEGWAAPTGKAASYAGIYIQNGGTVLNKTGGLVSGASGVRMGANGTDFINNAGLISASKGVGVYSYQGASIINTGTITGPHAGIAIGAHGTGAGSVTNSGLVQSTDNSFTHNGTLVFGSAIDLLGGGGATNLQGGTLIGGIGVYLDATNASNIISNAGLIEGTYKAGILLGGPAGALATNSGTVTGAGAGIYGRTAGDTVINSGYISGGTMGVVLSQGGTVIESGTIIGGTDAINLAGSNDELILQPGAHISGGIVATGASAVLDLASAATAASFDMGGTVTGFTNILFEGGAGWVLSGTQAELAGPGVSIAGFGAGDTLVIEGFTASSETLSVNGAQDELTLSNGATSLVLTISGAFTPSALTYTDVAAGTEIAICYLKGTRILTPTGEVKVEDLAIGDLVVTRFGGLQPIKWIGRQRHERVGADKARAPVRIRPNALAPGQPARDLHVSPGHALLVGDKLLLASLLVNGVTITQETSSGLVEYYQIELEHHDCVVAEGAFAETYADIGDQRAQFDNAAEFHTLYPDHLPPEELELCAKRPEKGEALATALLPVIAQTRAAPGPLRGWFDRLTPPHKLEGWALDEANPALPVLLEVLLDGEVIGEALACEFRADLAEAGIGDGRHGFAWRTPLALGADLALRLHIRRKADGAALPNTAPLPATAPRLRVVG
jgi:hypothetical protein